MPDSSRSMKKAPQPTEQAGQLAKQAKNTATDVDIDAVPDMLLALTQATPLATFCLDLDANVRLWNPAAQQIYGWSEQEVLGLPVPYIPYNREDEFRTTLEGVLQGEVLTGVEALHIKKDGDFVDVSVHTAPLRDAGSRINGVMIPSLTLVTSNGRMNRCVFARRSWRS